MVRYVLVDSLQKQEDQQARARARQRPGLQLYATHTPAPLRGGLPGDAKIRKVAGWTGTLQASPGARTPMRIDQAVNIEDLHRMAKRRLPKIAFDFIEGGLEDERGLETNTSAFHKHKLLPRYLVDVSKRD